MNINKKSNSSSKEQNSMTDSITSTGKLSYKDFHFFDNLQQPISMKVIQDFSKPAHKLRTPSHTHSLKIKKFESLDTNTTEQTCLMSSQQNFIESYKNDLFFRKKVDILIKQHQKRMKQKQDKQLSSLNAYSLQNSTWRSQKNAQDLKVVQMYQRCKKWITKSQQYK